MRSKFAVLFFVAGAVWAQPGRLDPQSTMDITFPEDSPVSVVSAHWGDSNASARGGAILLDLHTSLSLRNSSQRRLRGITLLVKAQDVTPGGKASVSVPSLNVAPGETFPIRIDLRLLRPLQGGNGAMVKVELDGVLFEDLTFFGPNTLNSRRSMIVWELEARRDRQYFKQVLERSGADQLRKAMLESLSHQSDRGAMDARVAHAGRSTVTGAERSVQFAFLEMPNAPVEIAGGKVTLSGDEVHSPRINLQNVSDRPIRGMEVGWLLKDANGKQFVAGSMPLEVTLAPRQTTTVVQENTFKFSQPNGQPISVSSMTGFVNSVEFSDGRLWIPERSGKMVT
ncbi:MAG: hypothetical protein ABI822_19495, partial [Bryobacteraceae bacterium]